MYAWWGKNNIGLFCHSKIALFSSLANLWYIVYNLKCNETNSTVKNVTIKRVFRMCLTCVACEPNTNVICMCDSWEWGIMWKCNLNHYCCPAVMMG